MTEKNLITNNSNSTQNHNLSPNQSFTSSKGSCNTNYMTNITLKNSIKEKDRKVKELKIQLSKMEKSLNGAKKIFDEKKKKNDIYIKENEVINIYF